MLDVDGATVSFGTTRAVDAASLRVGDGTVVALMGPSGSGKTTLLRAVAGLEHLDGGDIRWDGESVVSVPVHRRRFGVMFQDLALFPHRSVAENIAFGLRMQGWRGPAIDDRVAELLALTGLEGMGPRSVGTLSGGQQQRVALARTLAPRPRLLLLDEPLGSLDRALSEQVLDEMRAIFEQLESTVVYITHDRHEAFTIADEIAVMRDGNIVRSGTPESLWRDPQTEFLASFMGMANVLPAEAVASWLGNPSDRRAVVLEPNALRLVEGSAPGPEVTVIRDRFQGGIHRITVAMRDGCELVLHSSQRWPAGTQLRLDIDRGAVAWVD